MQSQQTSLLSQEMAALTREIDSNFHRGLTKNNSAHVAALEQRRDHVYAQLHGQPQQRY